MRNALTTTIALAAVTAAGAGAAATSAGAATGGGHLEKNPGIVALMDDNGNHICSGVLVAPQWVLTDSGSMPCTGAAVATGDTLTNASEIDDSVLPYPVKGWEGNDPRKSGAVLLHLDKPVKNVTPARLSDAHPKKGEKLDIVAFNGPEGINHALSLGKGSVVAKNHNSWASYYGAPKGLKLEGPVDNGAPIMRGGAVVGFTQVANPRGSNAEDISHLHSWITKVTGAK